jgi:hypothetical protein
MAVLPIEQPRLTPASATPMRLFLEGHRRRFIYILPELIYTLIGVLVLCSIVITVRTMAMEELRNLRKARINSASSRDLLHPYLADLLSIQTAAGPTKLV